MKQSILTIIFISLIFSLSAQTNSNFKHPKSYVCYLTNDSIKIDGNINEIVWQKAEWTDLFQDIEGDIKPKPEFETKVKMLWDNKYLYFAVEIEEPNIWATLTKRESVIFYDNDFEIFIDPDGDNHNYYEYEINAFGTEWDLLLTRPYRDGVKPLNEWNITGIKSAVKIYGTINNSDDIDSCWTIEIAMPWKAISLNKKSPFHPKNSEQWRMNFSRVEWQTDIVEGKYVKRKNPETNKNLPENNWVWSPQYAINMHQPETWGYVQFSEKIVGSRKDKFIKDDDFNIKMELMKVYKLQKKYFKKNEFYTASKKELGVTENEITKKITIGTASGLYFFAEYKTEEGEKWIVDSSGRIWQKK